MNQEKIKICYFGSGDLAADLLYGMCKDLKIKKIGNSEFENEIEFEIIAVITQPERILRKKTLENPVSKIAQKFGILTFKPENFKENLGLELNQILENSDLILTASYGQILPEKILNKPKFGAINWHPSRLPKYRGASPLQQTLMDGNTESALSWIEMVKKMDAGNIILQIPLKIENDWTVLDLSKEMVRLGVESWKQASLLQIESKKGEFKSLKQNENEASFCHKISKEDGFIDIQKMKAEEIRNHWRAYLAFPKTAYYSKYFEQKIKIVDCGKVFKNEEDLKGDKGDFDDLEIKKSGEFIQIKTKNGVLLTFLKAKEGFLEINKICLENGKNLDFKGLNIS